jgi:hypothetical protein
MPAILALARVEQGDCKLEASLSYIYQVSKKLKKKIPDDLSMNPVAHAHIQLLLDMHLGIDFVDHKLLLY